MDVRKLSICILFLEPACCTEAAMQSMSLVLTPVLVQDESHCNFFRARPFHFLEMLDEHLGAEH